MCLGVFNFADLIYVAYKQLKYCHTKTSLPDAHTFFSEVIQEYLAPIHSSNKVV